MQLQNVQILFVQEQFTEVSECLIAAMAQYFGENSVGLFKQRGQEKTITFEDYDVANLAAQHSYLKLLLILTSIHHPSIQIGKIILRETVLAKVLVYIVTTETIFPADIQRTAIGIIVNVVTKHDAWEYIFNSSPLSFSNGTRNGHKELVLNGFIRTAKTVREPDTFRKSCICIAVLRLLNAFVIHHNHLNSENTIHPERSTTYLEEMQVQELNWGWLRRLLYDRQAAVKLLVVEIIGHLTFDLKAASLNQSHTSDCEPNADWPPFQELGHLVTDTFECAVVKAAAARLLARSVHFNAKKQATTEHVTEFEGTIVVGALLRGITEVISTRTSPLLIAVCDALEAVELLLESKENQFISNNIALIRSLKLLPLIVELLNPDLKVAANKAIFTRIQLSIVGSKKCFIVSGWSDISDIGIDLENEYHVMQFRACRIIRKLRSVDRAMKTELFFQTFRYSGLLQHVTNLLAQPSLCLGTPNLIFPTWLQLQSTAMLMNILSDVIQLHSSIDGKVLGANPLIPRKVMRTTVSFIEVNMLLHRNQCVVRNEMLFVPVLRLMSLMMCRKEWRMQLGLVDVFL